MSATILLKSKQDRSDVLQLVKSAIGSEIERVQMAIELADKKLKPYELKYHITSEYFISNLAAEDLEARDDEYVSWAGNFS